MGFSKFMYRQMCVCSRTAGHWNDLTHASTQHYWNVFCTVVKISDGLRLSLISKRQSLILNLTPILNFLSETHMQTFHLMASNGFTICLSNPMEIKGPLIWWILFGCQNIRVSSLEQMAAIKCLILFLCIHRYMSIMTTCSQMIGEKEDIALSPILRSLAHQMKYVSQSKPINSPLAVQ